MKTRIRAVCQGWCIAFVNVLFGIVLLLGLYCAVNITFVYNLTVLMRKPLIDSDK